MEKKVSSVGALRPSYELEDIRLERRGYLSLFSYHVDGFAHRFEVLDRGQDAVIVLPVDWQRRVLYLIRQPRPNKALASAVGRSALDTARTDRYVRFCASDADVHTLDSPAGMIDGKETPVDAAIRETLEETGFVISAESLAQVSRHFTSTGCSTERHVCCLASVTKDTERRQPEGDGDEHIVTIEVPFDEAFAMLDEMRVEQSTLAVLLREVKLREQARAIAELESRLRDQALTIRHLTDMDDGF